MLRNALVILMLAGFATTAAAETVYKWLDTKGQVHYSDLPPTEQGAKVLGVFESDMVLEGNSDEPQDQSSASGASDTAPPGDEAADSSAAAQVKQDVDKARAEQCKKAQERYQTYIQSQRLFRQLPDGKREYLSDAELTAARVQAKKDVDELCK